MLASKEIYHVFLIKQSGLRFGADVFRNTYGSADQLDIF